MSQAGRRLAEMHVALASGKDLPDFAPVIVSPEDFELWIDDVTACAGRVFDALRHPHKPFSEAERPLVNQLLAEQARLPDRLRALLPRDIDCLNIRHHGNLHLGQLLIVKDDIFIVGFEGDPSRSIAERRRKAPAARDVAGLIRSIDCSTTATLERGLKATPDEHDKLAAALEGWREHATEALLTAYSETIEGPGLWPSRADTAEKLLNFFLIEKAFHEIEHGLTRRPDWLHVPLTGMLRLLSQLPFEA
jgi:maltose alpha-D-glucosyltransferase/alpha-amylase